MYITNEDLKVFIEVEDLLHDKLVVTNGIKGTYNGKDYYYFDENDKECEVWNKYWNIIEKLCVQKDKKNKINRSYEVIDKQ